MGERWLGPGEMARRLGVSPKALRVYEREGLVTPARTAAGWRVYGPAQAARLHQVMALRGLGVPLKRIRALLLDGPGSLADVLALQRDSLMAQRGALDAAIALLDRALGTLGAGRDLTLDDLTHLTKETVMDQPTPMGALKARFEALIADRLPGFDYRALAQPFADQVQGSGRSKAELFDEVLRLTAEGKAVMRTNSDESEAAVAFVRRWRAALADLREGISLPVTPAGGIMRDAMVEAMNEPGIRDRLPFDPAVFAFIRRVAAGMSGWFGLTDIDHVAEGGARGRGGGGRRNGGRDRSRRDLNRGDRRGHGGRRRGRGGGGGHGHGRGGALELQAATLEEGAGFHGQLLMGDVAVHIAGAHQANLLGGDGADHAAAGLNGLGLDGAFDMAGFADAEARHAHVAAHDTVDVQLTFADDIAFDGDVVGDERGHLRRLAHLRRGGAGGGPGGSPPQRGRMGRGVERGKARLGGGSGRGLLSLLVEHSHQPPKNAEGSAGDRPPRPHNADVVPLSGLSSPCPRSVRRGPHAGRR